MAASFNQCSAIAGSFNPANIVINGLAAGLSGSVVSKSDGVYLELTGGGGGPPSPTTSNPTANVSGLSFIITFLLCT